MVEHSAPSNQLIPLEFQKIKNHLLNDYSATEPGRFTYYLAKDQEHFWKLISERNPIPYNLQIDALSKAHVVWERLEKEPSPRRFVELCQAVIDHIYFIQSLPGTEQEAPMHFADTMHVAFMKEVWMAFDAHGQSNLLTVKKGSFDLEVDRSLEYTGNDFGRTESEKFVTHKFTSPIIESAITSHSERVRKKKWSISKLSPKIKTPVFDIGAEVERK